MRLPLRFFAVACSLLLFAVSGRVANAQDYRAKVQGLVTDPSQASISTAKVTLKNVNTGIEATKETDAAGRYLFDFVQPGTYTVSIEAPGFQRFMQENISVLTRGDVTVDASLRVGGVTEAVNVSEQLASVEFNTSTMTTTVQGSMLKDLPVLARNPFTLALLNPAVVNQYWDVSHRNPFYMWSNGGMDIGGPTGGKNDQELDGTTLNISARGSYNAPMDAVQEVGIQQNATDAEFGFSAGGTLNLSMKSGTNDIHGSAYYFGRNPALNALANRITRDENIIRQNIWGGTVGHPIIKNKLFNFVVLRAVDHHAALQQARRPCRPPWSAPAISRSRSRRRAPQRVIYDPLSTKFDPVTGVATRTPFAGNMIPHDRIDPTAQKVMGDLWQPNNPGDDLSGLNNFKKAYAWWIHYWNFSDRVDYNVNDKWRVFGRFSKFQTRLDNPNWGGTIAVPSDNGGIMDAMNAAADVLWMASPRTTVNVRFGVDLRRRRLRFGVGPGANQRMVGPMAEQHVVPERVESDAGHLLSRTSTSTGTAARHTGIGGWWLVHGRSYNPTVNVTHDIGKHHMKAGWQLRYSYDQDNANSGPGSLYFDSDRYRQELPGLRSPPSPAACTPRRCWAC